jgi:hypothetical protein
VVWAIVLYIVGTVVRDVVGAEVLVAEAVSWPPATPADLKVPSRFRRPVKFLAKAPSCFESHEVNKKPIYVLIILVKTMKTNRPEKDSDASACG